MDPAPQESSWFSWFLGEAAPPAAAPPADDAATSTGKATFNTEAIYLQDSFSQPPRPSSTLPRETLEAEEVRRQMSRRKIVQRQKTGPYDRGGRVH